MINGLPTFVKWLAFLGLLAPLPQKIKLLSKNENVYEGNRKCVFP
jgi:hypothetical protein